MPIRVGQFNSFSDWKMKHRIPGGGMGGIEQHLDWVGIIGVDMKPLLTPINDIRSIDGNIPEIVHNLLALQPLTHTTSKALARQPDRTGFIKSIGISNPANDHRRDATRIHWLVPRIIEVLIHL